MPISSIRPRASSRLSLVPYTGTLMSRRKYASAPMYWLQCQKGLFFRAMRFLRDQHFGGRLHVIVCVRDHVMASVLRSEHQNRYRGEPHITTLGWEYAASEFFLKEKILLSQTKKGFDRYVETKYP